MTGRLIVNMFRASLRNSRDIVFVDKFSHLYLDSDYLFIWLGNK